MSGPNTTLYSLLVFLIVVGIHGRFSYANDDVTWKVNFEPKNITNLHMNSDVVFNVTISNLDKSALKDSNATINIQSDSTIISGSKLISADDINDDGTWLGSLTFYAEFIGKANVFVSIQLKDREEHSLTQLPIIIIREERLIDKLFVFSVILLVSILYINFGAALDLKKVKAAIVRPIGPAIAFFCHFIFLPLSSYLLGLLLFPDNVPLQLGLFFTGASPAGGASNVWTVLLGGSLDLSITMSTTSTISAFVMMPVWIFTLGKSIFEKGEMVVPYGQIASYTYGLLIPLVIGLLIQRYCPKIARFLVRILKTGSAILVVFIVVFAIFTNLYLFKLFTWQIIIAGLLLPLLGYFVGWLVALLFKQEYEDRLAIAVEAGIQNTGIAIFVLRFALGQPQADLTTVMPVAVAIMTPFPLMAYYCCYKGREIYRRRRTRNFPHEIKECIDAQESGVY